MLKHDCFHYWMLPFFNATHCLNELHPEHTTQLAVKNRKRFGTHFPLWGKRGSRRKLWLNTDTIKVETERCLALGAACDPAGVSLAGCRDPQFGGLWETSTLKHTCAWPPGAWAKEVVQGSLPAGLHTAWTEPWLFPSSEQETFQLSGYKYLSGEDCWYI